jgi:hypothetical protein
MSVKPLDFQGTYGEWFQTVEMPRLSAIPLDVSRANSASHRIGNVDGVSRCIDCEIGSWNAWKEVCWNV